MHRRQLLILHTVLCIALALLAWRLVTEWRRANLRYGTPARAGAGVIPNLPPGLAQRLAPQVRDIVAKNLFSPDRNNESKQEEKPQAPPPPVPIVFGTMNLGGSYEALMAEGGSSSTTRPSFRRVKNGEKMGGYTVVEINDEKVVIDFLGQKTTLDVYQSASSVPRQEARSVPAAAPVVESGGAPQPPPAPASGTPASSGAPSQPGPDPYTRVTVEGNRRKVVRQTPFGDQVWYEDIK